MNNNNPIVAENVNHSTNEVNLEVPHEIQKNESSEVQNDSNGEDKTEKHIWGVTSVWY